MTAAELIAELQKVPPDTKVGTIEPDYDYMGVGYYSVHAADYSDGMVNLRFDLDEFIHDNPGDTFDDG